MAWSKRKRRVVAAAAIALAPAAFALAVYAKWTLVDHRLITITEGVLYQSAAMSPAVLVDTCAELGVRTVIDLRDHRPEDVRAEAAALRFTGIEHVHVPTRAHPFPDEVQAFLSALRAAEPPVLVHCHHGEGRSVMLCAVHRIEHDGWSNREAFDGTCRLPDSLRFVTDWLPWLRRFQETQAKGQFVLHYRPSGACWSACETAQRTDH